MRRSSRAAETSEGERNAKSVTDPLENVVVIAVEGVGHLLSSCQHAREITLVNSTGNVRRWLCRPEMNWHEDSPQLESHRPSDALRPNLGLGMDPADVAKDLRVVLEWRRIFALQPGAVTCWLHALFEFLDKTIPFQVHPPEDLYRELLPELESSRIVDVAHAYARFALRDAPNLVVDVSRALEVLRLITYRIEIGRLVGEARSIA